MIIPNLISSPKSSTLRSITPMSGVIKKSLYESNIFFSFGTEGINMDAYDLSQDKIELDEQTRLANEAELNLNEAIEKRKLQLDSFRSSLKEVWKKKKEDQWSRSEAKLLQEANDLHSDQDEDLVSQCSDLGFDRDQPDYDITQQEFEDSNLLISEEEKIVQVSILECTKQQTGSTGVDYQEIFDQPISEKEIEDSMIEPVTPENDESDFNIIDQDVTNFDIGDNTQQILETILSSGETSNDEFENQFEENCNRFKIVDITFQKEKQRLSEGNKFQNHDAVITSYEEQHGSPKFQTAFDHQRELNHNLLIADMAQERDLEYQQNENEPLLAGCESFDPLFKEIYQLQNKDIEKMKVFHSDSNFKAFFVILSQLFGLTFFLLPVAFKQVGLLNFGIGLVSAGLLNLFMLWQMHKSQSTLGTYYDDSLVSIFDLIKQSFVTKSCIFAEVLRMSVLMTILICLDMYMGSQSEAVLCKMTQQCGEKQDTLIRLAFNIMSLTFIFSDYIKIINQKTSKLVGLALISISLLLSCIFLSISIKKSEIHSNLTASLNHPLNVLEICGCFCLCMFLFESNQSLLKVKEEMMDAKQFMPVVSLAYVVYMVAALSFGGLGCLAPAALSSSGKGELEGILVLGKVMTILAFLNDYTMYQNRLFTSLDKFLPGPSTKTDSNMTHLLPKVLLTATIVFLSVKLPQNIPVLLKISGATSLMTLCALYPMLIFNKTFAASWPKTVTLNYLLIPGITIIAGIGAFGACSEIGTQLMAQMK